VAPVEVVKLISTAGSPDVWITTEHRERWSHPCSQHDGIWGSSGI